VSVRISVIVPTFDRCASVERMLRAFAGQTVSAGEFEVIVSIDGSEDGTTEMVTRYPAPFALRGIRQPNRGRAAACNAGLRAAAGGLVVFLDDDMEPAPDFLAAHLRAHAGAVPYGVIGAAPIVAPDGASPLAAFARRAFEERLDRLARSTPVQFSDAYTGNFSVPRAALENVGGYDESFQRYGHEDYELLLRLSQSGVRLVFSPHALAHQHYEKKFPAVARDAMARGHTAVHFARKHPEVVSRLRLGRFERETRKWRVLRGVLLRLGGVLDGVPEAIVWLVTRLERLRPARLDRYYTMALDYFYWVGARAALRERGERGASWQ
jgi:glycosyltransferase involved in cell wall biosynthesis